MGKHMSNIRKKLGLSEAGSRKSTQEVTTITLKDLQPVDYVPGEDPLIKRKAKKRKQSDVEHESVEYTSPNVSEQIKGWKHAASDIAKHRAAAGKNVHLISLKKDGGESKMNDAKKMFASVDDAERHHSMVVKNNPNRKIRHNLYVDHKLVKTLEESVTQVTEAADPMTPLDHKKHLDASGYLSNNPGGMANPSKRQYVHVKSHNVNGDDHLYSIFADYSGKTPTFKAKYKISRGYWTTKFYDPEIHKEVEAKDFKSSKRAVAHLDKIFKANKKKADAAKKAAVKKTPKKESVEDVSEALNMMQRLQRSRQMKKMKGRIKMGRARQAHKLADNPRLLKRARRVARTLIAKRFTQGMPKSELTFARRQEIEKRLDKMGSRIDRIAKRLLPKLRKADREKKLGND